MEKAGPINPYMYLLVSGGTRPSFGTILGRKDMVDPFERKSGKMGCGGQDDAVYEANF